MNIGVLQAAMPKEEKKKTKGKAMLDLRVKEAANGFTITCSRSKEGEYSPDEEYVFENAGDALEYVASELGAKSDDDEDDSE